MKNKKWILFSVAFVLMAVTAFALTWFRAHQKLGAPGIIAEKIDGSVVMKISLPERVLDYTSTNMPEPKAVSDLVPPDTSYAERIYFAPDGFWIQSTIILMGADRTSIHNADFCLTGQGFSGKEKFLENIRIDGNNPYSLPVARWNVSGIFQEPDGQKVERHGIYVFWFVAETEETPDHFQFLKYLTSDLLRTGVLQRWAYVSYFAYCQPGHEDAAFERVKNLIVHSVGEYQLPPAASPAVKN